MDRNRAGGNADSTGMPCLLFSFRIELGFDTSEQVRHHYRGITSSHLVVIDPILKKIAILAYHLR